MLAQPPVVFRTVSLYPFLPQGLGEPVTYGFQTFAKCAAFNAWIIILKIHCPDQDSIQMSAVNITHADHYTNFQYSITELY